MSNLVDARTIFDETNLSTSKSALLDLSEADLVSIGITVTACTGSNLLDLFESVDGINFVPVASLIITIPGTTIWHIYPVFSQFKKILYTPGTGSATFTVIVNIHNHTILSSGRIGDITAGVS